MKKLELITKVMGILAKNATNDEFQFGFFYTESNSDGDISNICASSAMNIASFGVGAIEKFIEIVDDDSISSNILGELMRSYDSDAITKALIYRQENGKKD